MKRLTIERHKTAISRTELSKPVALAITHQIITIDTSFFDYGCGKGDDLKSLSKDGFLCTGWDPYYSPDKPKSEADIVNLGYVLNVIEAPAERTGVLKDAFSLARKCLVVSAQVLYEQGKSSGKSFQDGLLTQKNTFQKYYDQLELKSFIESSLGVDAIPASLGIFFVFKSEELLQDFLAQRSRRTYVPRLRRIGLRQKFLEHKELLSKLVTKIEELGRNPRDSELESINDLRCIFGSLPKAIVVAEQFFENFSVEDARQRIEDDLTVYIALANFARIPQKKDLNPSLVRTIEELFGNYRLAIDKARALLFSIGEPSAVSNACAKSPIGKLLPDDLYVHVSEKDNLVPILRIYVGCGERYVGDIPEANVIKIHRHSGKVSFLIYKDFDKSPHPELLSSTRVDFRHLKINYIDFSNSSNPPILHRKETLVSSSYPNYDKFILLTEAEEKLGLYCDTRIIGHKEQWNALVTSKGYKYSGHRLMRLK